MVMLPGSRMARCVEGLAALRSFRVKSLRPKAKQK